MVRSKKGKNAEAKTVSLLTAVVVMLMSLTYVPDWARGLMPPLATIDPVQVGIAVDAPLAPRLVYPFFHASFIHAAVNAWCILCVVFIYDVSIWRLLTAYIVAVAVPGFLLSDVPTVGLSCICFFLLGSLIFEVRRKLWFMSSMALYIAVGFLFPSVNALIHLYGYCAGLFVGALFAPVSCFRLKK